MRRKPASRQRCSCSSRLARTSRTPPHTLTLSLSHTQRHSHTLSLSHSLSHTRSCMRRKPGSRQRYRSSLQSKNLLKGVVWLRGTCSPLKTPIPAKGTRGRRNKKAVYNTCMVQEAIVGAFRCAGKGDSKGFSVCWEGSGLAPRIHRRPFVGVSHPRSWSRFLVLVAIVREIVVKN